MCVLIEILITFFIFMTFYICIAYFIDSLNVCLF